MSPVLFFSNKVFLDHIKGIAEDHLRLNMNIFEWNYFKSNQTIFSTKTVFVNVMSQVYTVIPLMNMIFCDVKIMTLCRASLT